MHIDKRGDAVKAIQLCAIPSLIVDCYKKLSYRKQIVRQLRTQYVESIYVYSK